MNLEDRRSNYINQAVKRIMAELDAAGAGGRNNALFLAACQLAELPGTLLNHERIRNLITPAALNLGLSKAEAKSTLRSALRTGRRSTRPWPPDLQGSPSAVRQAAKKPSKLASEPQPGSSPASTALSNEGIRISGTWWPSRFEPGNGAEFNCNWSEFADRIRSPRADLAAVPKQRLPQFSLARFRVGSVAAERLPGDDAQARGGSRGGHYRSLDTLYEVTGLCLDLDHAADASKSSLAAAFGRWGFFAYTTSSHLVSCEANPEGGPRWRVLLPLSRAVTPDEADVLLHKWAPGLCSGAFLPGKALDGRGQTRPVLDVVSAAQAMYVPAPTAKYESVIHPGTLLDPDLVLAACPASETADPSIGEDEVGQDDARPVIEETTELHEAADLAVAALGAGAPDIYQREGKLVQVVRLQADTPTKPGEVARHAGDPTIREISWPTLTEQLTRSARWEKRDGRSGEVRPARPSRTLVEVVLSRAQYPGLRMLEGVVTSPVLRADGTILSLPGYDAATCLLYEPGGALPEVPEHPTREQALAAAELLLDAVVDFPFRGPADRCAWLAALLTLFAMPAITGPVPLFYFDANVRGSGKSRLANLAGRIFGGGEVPALLWPTGNHDAASEELRKQFLGVAMSGARLLILDNVNGPFGNLASLDAALTSRKLTTRKLGTNEVPEVPWNVTMFATGNNAVIVGDMDRRIIPIRLVSPHECPEERQDFVHPDLWGWVRQNRASLASAALTLLRAFFVAGRPQQKLLSMDFTEWSAVVRQPLVWLGLGDPAATRSHLVVEKPERFLDQSLLLGWDELAGVEGLSVADVLALVRDGKDACQCPLRPVLEELFGLKSDDLPDTRKLGNKLRSMNERVVDGMCFEKIEDPSKRAGRRWRVRRAAPAGSAGSAGSASPPSGEEADERVNQGRTLFSGFGQGQMPQNPQMPQDDPSADGTVWRSSTGEWR